MRINFDSKNKGLGKRPNTPYLGIFRREKDEVLVLVRHNDIVVIAGLTGDYQCGAGDRWDSHSISIMDFITPLNPGEAVTLWMSND